MKTNMPRRALWRAYGSAALLAALLVSCTAPEPLAAPEQLPEKVAEQPEYMRLPDEEVALRYFRERILIVDKSERLLTYYENGQPVLMIHNLRFGDMPNGHKRYEGDERTPEGLYYIEGRNPESAFHLSLKVSYPNEYDVAWAASHNVSPGGDIFLHGQPNGYEGPVQARDWTDGCIAMSNDEIRQVWSSVPDGTPILIRQ